MIFRGVRRSGRNERTAWLAADALMRGERVQVVGTTQARAEALARRILEIAGPLCGSAEIEVTWAKPATPAERGAVMSVGWFTALELFEAIEVDDMPGVRRILGEIIEQAEREQRLYGDTRFRDGIALVRDLLACDDATLSARITAIGGRQ